jgi:hypothetical protein
LQNERGQILPHPRRVPAGQDQAAVIGRDDIGPADGVLELLVRGELPVEALSLCCGPELSEQDAGQQARVGGRPGPGALGGERHPVAG